MTTAPNRESFSQILPDLQLALDSVSIGEAKTCWMKYKLSIIDGWQKPGDSVHFDFGIFFHSATEEYHKVRALPGATSADALDAAVNRALVDTWDNNLQRPWASDDPNKNRASLIRSIIWYFTAFETDSLKTVILSTGEPAIEIPFSLDLDIKSRLTGESFILCGRLDRLVEKGENWITDVKTTKFTVNQGYFARFSPDNQVSCYSLAGLMLFKLPIAGVIIDAVQLAVGFPRFRRGFIARSKPQLEEWLKDLHRLISDLERNIYDNHWPMNDKACGIPHVDERTGEMRGGCQFREICSSSPVMREKLLELKFKKRYWDPLNR